MPLRSQDQARQHFRSFCLHQVLHSLMGRTTEYTWIFRSSSKLCFQRVKNQVNRRFLQADMAESPMIARPDLDSKQSWSETAIAPSYELRLRWMSTRWKSNFIYFSIETYFCICSVMYTGENPRGRGSRNTMRTREWRWGRQQRKEVWEMRPLDHTWRNSEAWNKTKTPGALANKDTSWRQSDTRRCLE
jgi:hypothetical protein